MKKKMGLIGMLGLAGCIFVHSHETPSALLLKGDSERFEHHGNHVAVEYFGPWGEDTARDDYIIIQSYGPRSFYHEEQRLISSGDSACVLGIKLKFEIVNDNDQSTGNNILKIDAGRCR